MAGPVGIGPFGHDPPLLQQAFENPMDVEALALLPLQPERDVLEVDEERDPSFFVQSAHWLLLGTRRRESSERSSSCTGAGAPSIKELKLVLLGNAMVSRNELRPARSMTRRSRPRAIPPCGGAPYWKALRRKP